MTITPPTARSTRAASRFLAGPLSRAVGLAGALGLTGLLGLAAVPLQAQTTTAPGAPFAGPVLEPVLGPIAGNAAVGELVPITITLVTPMGRAALIGLHAEPEGATRARAVVAQVQDAFLRDVLGRAPGDRAALEAAGIARLENLPILSMQVPPEAVEELRRHPMVSDLTIDQVLERMLDGSVRQIGMPEVYFGGYRGTGTTVAVLDDSGERNHPFLRDRLVYEACFVVDNSCPNGTNTAVGPGASAGAPGADHGIHVMGIAAGQRLGGQRPTGPMGGVAPGADIVSIDVFNANGGGSTASIERALDRVLTLAGNRTLVPSPIATVNLSLGIRNLPFTNTCDDYLPSMTDLFAALTAARVAVVVASGNDGFRNAASFPSCISSAIAVGNVTSQDTINFSSNTSAHVRLLAPGTSIRASGRNGSFVSKSGTSMAAPHVAGAFAVLRGCQPNATVPQILQALRSTGLPISNGTHSVPRIRMDRAAQALGCLPSDAVTNTRLSVSPPSQSLRGEGVTLSALVESLSGQATGQVIFRDGGNEIGRAGLQAAPVGPGAISAGALHSCAVTALGGGACWGVNTFGQLGDGTRTDRNLRVVLNGGWNALSAGGGHTCGLQGSAVWCWGDNRDGQLGDSTRTERVRPVRVFQNHAAQEIVTGLSFTCSRDGGRVSCWGNGLAGQLGQNLASSTVPRLVPGLENVRRLAAGYQHACALTDTGQVLCWGSNGSGQLGDGTQTSRSTPQPVQGLPGGIVDISASLAHTCAVDGSGGAWCWGWNNTGQLGDNSVTSRTRPVRVSGLSSGVAQIAAGQTHSCARLTTGAVRCWGSNLFGQLGDGNGLDRRTPVTVQNLDSAAVAISAGGGQSCAATATGRVRCWGNNSGGSLGDGTNRNAGQPTPTVAVAARRAALARLDTAALPAGLRSLSAAYPGQGVHRPSASATVAHTVQLPTVTGLAISPNPALPGDNVTMTATVTTTEGAPIPCCSVEFYSDDLPNFSVTVAVSNGTARHSVANLPTGTASFRARFLGTQLHRGSQSAPVALSIGPVATQTLLTVTPTPSRLGQPVTLRAEVQAAQGQPTGNVSFGAGNLALGSAPLVGGVAELVTTDLPAGMLQLTASYPGNTRFNASTAAPVTHEVSEETLDTATDLRGPRRGDAGEPLTFTARVTAETGPPPQGRVRFRRDGSVFAEARLDDEGMASVTTTELPPGTHLISARFTGGNGFTASVSADLQVTVSVLEHRPGELAAGVAHTCRIEEDRSVSCWGRNRLGQLGDGTLDDRLRAVRVPGLDRIAQIAAGRNHTCALRETGRVFCWGDNEGGQLGDRSRETRLLPTRVPDVDNVVRIAAGGNHSCALRDTGRVFCWGSNDSGQLGDGSTVDRTQPVRVRNLDRVIAIAAGGMHSCALRDSGRVFCWGRNAVGQLGDGTTDDRTTPVRVLSLTRATALTTGGSHSCGLRDTGRVFCWGNNASGQLGNGSTTNRLRPVRVANLSRVDRIIAGGSHGCALRDNGRVFCWGDNGSGRLGDGTTARRTRPVRVRALEAATRIVAGAQHSCALRDSGRVFCWGNGRFGRLGDGSEEDRLTPVRVMPPLD